MTPVRSPRAHESLRHVRLALLIGAALVLASTPRPTSATTPHFSDTVVSPDTGGVVASALGDMNGDGRLDVVMIHSTARLVSVCLGAGDGTLGPPRYAASAKLPVDIELHDMNGDGWLDVVVGNALTSPDSGSVSIFLGDGLGGLAPRTDFMTGRGTLQIAIGDLNGDGLEDVACTGTNGISILLGQGDGSTLAYFRFLLPHYPNGIAIADLNADGIADLAGTDRQYPCVWVVPGIGNGDFATPVCYDAPSSPAVVVPTDIDHDGIPDLVVRGKYQVSVLPGNGDGTFRTRVSTFSSIPDGGLVVADLDLDGWSDVVFGASPIECMLGDGSGRFQACTQVSPGYFASTLAVGDLDGEGHPDLVTSLANNLGIGVLLASPMPAGMFARRFDCDDASAGRVGIGDLDGDGLGDLVYRPALGTSYLNVAFGQPGRVFALPVAVTDPVKHLGFLGLQDLDGNGTSDLLARVDSTGDSIILPGLGSWQNGRYFGSGSVYAGVGTVGDPARGDLDGDGRQDLVFPGGAHAVRIFYGTGDCKFSVVDRNIWTSLPYHVDIGDFNGDGMPDLATINASYPVVTTEMAPIDGTYAVYFEFWVSGRSVEMKVGDLDHDGIPDVVRLDQEAEMVSVLRGLGQGQLGTESMFGVGDTPCEIILRDFNGDATLDVAVLNQGASGARGSVSVLIGRGDGGFEPRQDFPVGINPVHFAAGDVDGDGMPELACVNSVDQTISVLFNDSPPPPAAVAAHVATPVSRLALRRPVPHPVTQRSSIALFMARASRVDAVIVDIAGRRVRSLLAGASLVAGEHVLAWDGRDEAGHRVSSGVYLLLVRAGDERASTRLVVTN